MQELLEGVVSSQKLYKADSPSVLEQDSVIDWFKEDLNKSFKEFAYEIAKIYQERYGRKYRIGQIYGMVQYLAICIEAGR